MAFGVSKQAIAAPCADVVQVKACGPDLTWALLMRSAASIGQQFPWLEDNGVLDVLIPKKEAVVLGKM